MLGYRIDLFFHDYKLAIGIDENRYSDRNTDYEMKKQKATQQNLGGEFIGIDPEREVFDIFRIINKIFRYIKSRLIN